MDARVDALGHPRVRAHERNLGAGLLHEAVVVGSAQSVRQLDGVVFLDEGEPGVQSTAHAAVDVERRVAGGLPEPPPKQIQELLREVIVITINEEFNI